jgi:hypothetical protein
MAIAATIEGDALVTTGIALLHVTTQCRSATLLNGTHDAALPTAQSRRVVFTVERPDLAKDVRHFEPDRAHRWPSEMNLWTDRRLRRIRLG